jgi:GAF domain-containing protein
MLARKHRLGVGQTGIVGYVTSTGNPRIALDTGADTVFFDNPDLPETRSEMALPLRVGKTIVGALDVQSTEPNAFAEDDVEVLSILADVVSVAIENARLFEESQRVLKEAQTTLSKSVLEAWHQIAKKREMVGYELSGTSIRPLENPLKSVEIRKAKKTGLISPGSDEKKNKHAALAVPIKLRDQVIGTMNISLPEDREWDSDEVDIAQALAERVGVAVENATLLEESRRRATMESMIGDISNKISTSTEVERIMKVAAGELRQALGASEVSLRLSKEETLSE